MRIFALLLSGLILALVKDGQARSLDGELKCATTCADPVNQYYDSGKSYEYTYDATVKHSFQTNASPDQTSQLEIQANFRIDVLSPCEHVLTVTQAYIDNGDLQEWQAALMQNPLHFSYQDGVIPTICAANSDPTWVLNIKRGILSSLQVSSVYTAASVQEADVTGECEVNYSVESSDTNDAQTITKVKDFSKCAGRQQELGFSHFTPFSTGDRQDFVNSNQICRITMQRRQIQGTECVETHTFRPFSSEQSGAKSVITSTLTRTGIRRTPSRASVLSSGNIRRSTLGFEKEVDNSVSQDITEIRSVFSDICQVLDTEHYQQVGKDFIKLVFLLRRLDAPAIEQTYSSLNGACNGHNDALKGMFVDALQWCGSEGCVVFSTTLIAAGPSELDDATANRWLFGMSLITKPTLPMLDGLTNVVMSGRLMEQSYLTTGTMIHKVCADQPNCLNFGEVTRALSLFEEKLGVNCRTSNMEQKENILLALRAIGNAGRSNAVNILSQCAQETYNDMDTRVAAIQAFRRMPCGVDKSLSSIFFDIEDDSEARIGAYLSLMRCPNQRFIEQTKAMLQTEPVYQVSNFVWSHLSEMAESNDPLKGYLKPMLIDLLLSPPQGLDPRKYSRFYETSFYSEGLNAGATVESSLVWSPKSFVPRSAAVNVTVDIFGQAVNLFEVGGRVEGVESFVKSMLQSDSFKNSPIGKIFIEATDDDEEADEFDVEDNHVDGVPSSADEAKIMEISEEFKRGMPQEKSSASYFLRVFGNEMFYSSSQLEKSVAEEIAESSEIRSIMSQIAQGGSYNYHDDMLIINSAHVLPTGVGLPLQLAFNGSVSIDMNIQGQLDMSGLFSLSPNLAFRADVNPRAAIVFNGAMSVDAHVTKSGIQTESTSLTSWKIGGRASMDRGQNVEVQIDTPYDRNTVVNFDHKLMKVIGNTVTELGNSNGAVNSNDCTPEFAGHRLCLSQPSEVDSIVFPSSGAVSYSVHAQKTDADLTHFLFTGSYDMDYETGYVPRQMHVQARFETPGSSVDRTTDFGLDYDIDDMTFSCTLRHPELNMKSKAKLVNDPMDRKAQFSFGMNGDSYEFEVGLKQTIDGVDRAFALTSSLALPESEPINLAVTFAYSPSSTISIQSRLENLMPEPIILNTNINNLSNTRKGKLRFTGDGKMLIPYILDTSYGFEFNFRPKTDVYIVSLTYQFGANDEESVKVQYKMKDRSNDEETNWKAEHSLTSTQFPSFNHDISLKYYKSDELMQSGVEVQYGKRYKKDDNQQKIIINQEFGYSASSLHGNMAIEIPELGVNNTLDVNFASNDTAVDVSLGYNGYDIAVTAINKGEERVSRAFILNIDSRNVEGSPIVSIIISTSMEETAENVYQLNADLEIGNTKDMAITAAVGIENLSSRKSLTFDVHGQNEVSLVKGHSIHESTYPATWTSENKFVYNNVMYELNGSHQGQKEGGFESAVKYLLNGNVQAGIEVDFESDARSSSKMVKLSFSNPAGIENFAKIEIDTNSKSRRASDSYTATAEFSSNINEIPVRSFQLNLNTENTPSSMNGDVNSVLNGNELLGIGGAYSAEDGKTIDLTVRQGLAPSAPETYAVKVYYDVANNGDISASAAYTQDSEASVAIDVDLLLNSNVFSVKLTQGFTADFPSATKFTVSLPGGASVNTELQFDDNVVSLDGSYAPGQLNIDFSQDAAAPISALPSVLKSAVMWGTRQEDGKQGLWITTTLDQNQKMTMEFMLEKSTPEVSAILSHNVRSLDLVPQVSAVITPIVNEDGTVDISLALDVDDVRMLESNIRRESDSVFVNFIQRFTNSIPNQLEFEGTGHWNGIDSADFETSFVYDDTTTKLAGVLTSGMGKVTYNSDCEWLAGDLSLQLAINNGNSFTLTYLNNGIEKTATGSITYDSLDFGFSFNQNIFTSGVIPEDISGSMSRTDNSVTLVGKYEDYMFNVVQSWKIDSKCVFTTKIRQNIIPFAQRFNLDQEVDFNPYTSFEYAATYRLDRRQSASLGLVLSTSDNIDGTVTFSTKLTQNEAFFSDNGVPESISIGLTYPSDARSAAQRVALTLDVGSEKTLDIDISGNWDEKDLTISFTQQGYSGIPFESFSYSLMTPLTIDPSASSISLNQEVTIDEVSYKVGASVGYELDMDTATGSLNLGMTHSIPMLTQYKIPTSVAFSTSAHLGQIEESGNPSTLKVVISKTMTDANTDAETDSTNTIDAGLELSLPDHLIAFTLSHDFGSDLAIPEDVKIALSMSNEDSESTTISKTFKLSVELDNNVEEASVAVNYNAAEGSFSLSTSQNFEDLSFFGVPQESSVSFDMDGNNFEIKLTSDDYQQRIGFDFDFSSENMMLKLNVYHDLESVADMGIPKKFGIETDSAITSESIESNLQYVWGDSTGKANVQSSWDFTASNPVFNYQHIQDLTENTVFPQSVKATFNVRNAYDKINLRLKSSVGDLTVSLGSTGLMSGSADATFTLQFAQSFLENAVNSVVVSGAYNLQDLMAVTMNLDINVDSEDLFELGIKETTSIEDSMATMKINLAQQVTKMIPNSVDFLASGQVEGMSLSTDITVTIDGAKPIKVSFNTGLDMDDKSAFLELSHGQRQWARQYNVPRTLRTDANLQATADGHRLVIKLKRGKNKEKVIFNVQSQLGSDSVYGAIDFSQNVDELTDVIPTSGGVSFFGQATASSVAVQLNMTYGDVAMKHALDASYTSEDSSFAYDIEFKQQNVYLDDMQVPSQVASSMHLDWAKAYSGSFSGTYGDDFVTLAMSSDLKNKASLSVNFNILSIAHDFLTTITVANQQADLYINLDNVEKQATLSGITSDGYARVSFTHDFAVPVPNDVTASVTYRLDPDVYVMLNTTVDGHPYSASSSFKKLENDGESGFNAALTLFNIVREITVLQNFSPSQLTIKMNHNIDEIVAYVPGTVALNGGLENGALNLGLTVDETEYVFEGQADLQQMKLSYEHNIEALPLPKVMSIQVGGSMEPLAGNLELTMDQTSIALFGKLDDSSFTLSASHNIEVIPVPQDMSTEINWGTNPMLGKLSVSFDDNNINALIKMDSGSFVVTASQNVLSSAPGSIELSGDISMETVENMNGQLSLTVDENNGKFTITLDGNTFEAQLMHNVATLPLPTSIKFTEAYTVEPYSCQMNLYFGDDVYSLGGELDLTAQRGSVSQNIPQLIALGLPSEASVQATGSMQPLSGELLVSLNGVESRAAASVDTNAKLASFSQNFVQGFPANVEFTLSGSLNPLSGKISLSVDGEDRSVVVDGENNANVYEMRHSVPELMGYVPEVMSFGLDFTSSSFKVNAGYTIENIPASYGMTGSWDENHIECTITHDCEHLPIPKVITLGLAGSTEFKNASVSVELDDKFVNARGDILSGEGEGWYGVVFSLTHNILAMEQNIPTNTEISAKGKPIDMGVQVALGVESESIIDYSGLLDLTFSNEETMLFKADYSHVLNSEEAESLSKLEVDYSNVYNPIMTFTESYSMGSVANTWTVVTSASIDESAFTAEATIQATDDNTDTLVRNDIIRFNTDLESLTMDLQVKQPELINLGVPARSTVEVTMPEENNGRTFAINIRLGDKLVVLETKMPKMSWEDFGVEGRFVQNMCDTMPRNVSTGFSSSYEIVNNMRLETDMTLKFIADDTIIKYNRQLSLSPTKGRMESETRTTIPFWGIDENETTSFTYSMVRGQLNVALTSQQNSEPHYTFAMNGNSKEADLSFELYTGMRISFATSGALGKRTVEFHSKLDVENEPIYNLDTAVNTRRGTASFDFSLNDSSDDSSVEINYAITQGSVSISETNNGYSSFLADKLALTVVYDDIPATLQIVYNEGELNANLVYSQTSKLDATLTMDQTLCEDMPSQIKGTASFSHPREFDVELIADEATIILVGASGSDLTVKVNDLSSNNLFSLVGSFTSRSSTSYNARAELALPPVDFAYVLETGISIFSGDENGRTTVDVKLINSNNEENIHLNMYAEPTEGGHAADFFSQISLDSTYSFMPFEMLATYDSKFAPLTSTYSYDFKGQLDEKTLSVSGKVGTDLKDMTLNAEQTFTDAFISFLDLTIDTTERSDFDWSTVSTIAFDNFEATLTQEFQLASSGFIHSNIKVPGCTMFGTTCTDMTSNLDWQFDVENRDFVVQGKVLIDDASVLVNAKYSQPEGHHNINIECEQNVFVSFPVQTTGVIDILAQGSSFSFEGKLDSPTENLITLTENFSVEGGVVSNELLYKFFTTGLTYFKSDFKATYVDDMVEVSTNTQVNSMPEMSALARLTIENTDEGNNITVAVSMKTGPLSKYLAFRKLASGVWYHHQTEDFFLPEFGGKVDIDGDVYYLHTTNDAIVRRGGRYNIEATIQHPHDLSVLGMRIPKTQSISLSLLTKPAKSMAIRFNVQYTNNLLHDEVRLTNKLRINNSENEIVELDMGSSYDSISPYTIKFNLERDTDGFNYIASGQLQLSSMIDMNAKLGVVNSDEKIGFDVELTNNLDDKTNQVSGYYMYEDQTLSLDIVMPDREPIHLTGDLKELISQAKDAISRIMTEATSSSMSFVKGIEKSDTGYDMYFGYEVEDEGIYTMHLIVDAQPKVVSAKLQVKENFNFDSEIASVSISVPEGRYVKVELSANPVLANFVQDTLFAINGEFSQKATWAANNVNDVLLALKTVLTGDAEIEEYTATYIDQAVAKVNSLRNVLLGFVSETTTEVAQNIQSSEAKSQKMIKNGLGVAVSYISTLNDFVAEPFKQLVEEYYKVELDSVADFITEQLLPIKELLDRVNAGDAFNALVKELIDNGLNYITMNGEATLISTRIPLKDLVVVTNSQILITIPLQFEIDHFVPLPTLEDIENWFTQTAMAVKINEALEVLFSYADDYYRARALISIPTEELLPPFKGHFFVSGFRHFSTFDQRAFDYTSDCGSTHVLAADMKTGNFSVSLTYADPSSSADMNSINVITAGSSIIVREDYSVAVDGKTTQMPFNLGEVMVSREGNTVHVRRSDEDLHVACNFVTELCTVDISPYYFGATAGLAGIYNNEPNDDFTGKSHDKLDDAAAMASSWEVSSEECSSRNINQECSTVPETCRNLFEDLSSPFRPCFPLVDPEAYLKMCANDMCNSDDESKTCAASAAYQYRCGLAGAVLETQPSCIVCSDVNGETFNSTETKQTQMSGADVVFVMEEGRCLDGAGAKSMRRIFKKLGGQLQNKKLTDTTYQFVGFGGAQEQPHSYTVDNDLFISKKHLPRALKRVSQQSTVSTSGDALAAISYASQLPFRSGAKPIIILISCDECSQSTEVTVPQVQSQLERSGISFHHFNMQPVDVTPGSRKLFGYNSDFEFDSTNTKSSVQTLTRSETDQCALLATSAGGSVWHGDHVTREAGFSSQFSDYITSVIPKRQSHTCTCGLNDAGIATATCTM